MSIREQLTNLQNELKAPKGQYNNFGKYKYRNAEDILEAVKPLLKKHDLTQVISDEIVQVGERYYVKSTVTVTDKEGAEITATAFARETETKKGMDEAQVTGATSSYARKYALNGIYAIDDTKDFDTDEFQNQSQKIKPKQNLASQKEIDVVINQASSLNINNEELKKIMKELIGKDTFFKITVEENNKIFNKLTDIAMNIEF